MAEAGDEPFLEGLGQEVRVEGGRKRRAVQLAAGGMDRRGVSGRKPGAVSALAGGGKLTVSFRGWHWHGEVSEERRSAGASTGPGGGDSDLIAQFPGKVRKILVQAGARVNEGDPLVLLEAMKMEFSIRAPFAGTVAKLLVQEGQQISPGTRLLDLMPEGAGG